MNRKVTFNFLYKNGLTSTATILVEENEIEEYIGLAIELKNKMQADLGHILQLACQEGLKIIRLSEVVDITVKGL